MTLPEGLGSLGTWAFGGCSSLESVTVQEGLKRLVSSPFKDCKNLKEIRLPASLEVIYSSSFTGCDSLTDIYYAGTEEQWNAIDGIILIKNITIHYES